MFIILQSSKINLYLFFSLYFETNSLHHLGIKSFLYFKSRSIKWIFRSIILVKLKIFFTISDSNDYTFFDDNILQKYKIFKKINVDMLNYSISEYLNLFFDIYIRCPIFNISNNLYDLKKMKLCIDLGEFLIRSNISEYRK